MSMVVMATLIEQWRICQACFLNSLFSNYVSRKHLQMWQKPKNDVNWPVILSTPQDRLEQETEWNVWLFIVNLFYMYILYIC